jgi:hypothetical protein
MPSIIVSSRGDDSRHITGRIVDRLDQHYGNGHVFWDVDSIPYGMDVRQYRRETFDRCDVLVAVVGSRWISPDASGTFPIADPADPIRVEIETALSKNIPIIPVTVDRARMPNPDELPESSQDFAYLQPLELDTGRDFHPHTERLIQAIAEIAARRGTESKRSDGEEEEEARRQEEAAEQALREYAERARQETERRRDVVERPQHAERPGLVVERSGQGADRLLQLGERLLQEGEAERRSAEARRDQDVAERRRRKDAERLAQEKELALQQAEAERRSGKRTTGKPPSEDAGKRRNVWRRKRSLRSSRRKPSAAARKRTTGKPPSASVGKTPNVWRRQGAGPRQPAASTRLRSKNWRKTRSSAASRRPRSESRGKRPSDSARKRRPNSAKHRAAARRKMGGFGLQTG